MFSISFHVQNLALREREIQSATSFWAEPRIAIDPLPKRSESGAPFSHREKVAAGRMRGFAGPRFISLHFEERGCVRSTGRSLREFSQTVVRPTRYGWSLGHSRAPIAR